MKGTGGRRDSNNGAADVNGPAPSKGGGVGGGGVPFSRRSLLTKGAAGGAILFLGGSTALFFSRGRPGKAPRQPLRILTSAEYAIFAAVAARVCPRDGETLAAGEPAKAKAKAKADAAGGAGATWPPADSVDCAGKVDALMTELHPQAAAEFRQLLHVFENGVTGLFSIGSPRTFTASGPAEQDRRLEAWRRSRVAVFRSGYQAMKRLAHATYYSSPETYALVGYPGPPVVPQIPS